MTDKSSMIKEEKLPPLPWTYTEDKKEEMFSIHTEGQDPVDCDNRFIVCGVWYQSSGMEHGKAIADLIINSVNRINNYKIQAYEQIIELDKKQELIRRLVTALEYAEGYARAFGYDTSNEELIKLGKSNPNPQT